MKSDRYIDDLIYDLDNNPLIAVTFRTKSGTERVMECSRMDLYIPEEVLQGRFNYRLIGDSIIGVFDYQNGDWRAFRKDSIISYKILDWNEDVAAQ